MSLSRNSSKGKKSTHGSNRTCALGVVAVCARATFRPGLCESALFLKVFGGTKKKNTCKLPDLGHSPPIVHQTHSFRLDVSTGKRIGPLSLCFPASFDGRRVSRTECRALERSEHPVSSWQHRKGLPRHLLCHQMDRGRTKSRTNLVLPCQQCAATKLFSARPK